MIHSEGNGESLKIFEEGNDEIREMLAGDSSGCMWGKIICGELQSVLELGSGGTFLWHVVLAT